MKMFAGQVAAFIAADPSLTDAEKKTTLDVFAAAVTDAAPSRCFTPIELAA